MTISFRTNALHWVCTAFEAVNRVGLGVWGISARGCCTVAPLSDPALRVCDVVVLLRPRKQRATQTL